MARIVEGIIAQAEGEKWGKKGQKSAFPIFGAEKTLYKFIISIRIKYFVLVVALVAIVAFRDPNLLL